MGTSKNFPLNLGFGLGLRHQHYDEVLKNRPNVDWFEIISENYITAHSGYWDYLYDIRQHYPIIMHGVCLSIGSTSPLDENYLTKIKALAHHIDVPWISDHLCFTGVNGQNTHDLLPVPYTEEALKHIIPRIHKVQETLKRPFALENASTYLEFNSSTLTEPEFFQEICRQTGCGILLDVNNVYVSSFNHGWDAKTYIDNIPAEFIMQYHLAGHTNKTSHIIDTHNDYVADPVWDLFRYTLKTKGLRSTMIEWDEDIPELSVLISELDKARSCATNLGIAA